MKMSIVIPFPHRSSWQAWSARGGGCRMAMALLASVMVTTRSRAQPSGSAVVQLPNVNALPVPPARIPIFYPPEPPAPGMAIDRIAPLRLGRWDAPTELAAYVGESFYPLLGSRIAEEDFPKKLRERVEAYRVRRDATVEGLRRAVRESAVDAVALTANAKAALDLENEAEQLRLDLRHEEFEWGRFRGWNTQTRIGEGDEKFQVPREYHFLRAMAYYGESLPPAQRRLLRDFVIRFSRGNVTAREVKAEPMAAGAVTSFWPETALIHWPAKLSPALVADVAAWLEQKHALQAELVRTLLDADAKAGRVEKRALAALATKQAPQLTALEESAERLRAELAKSETEPPSVDIPDGLRKEARAFGDKRLALQQELIDKLVAVRRKQCRYVAGAEALVWDANFQSGGVVTVDASRGPPNDLMAVVNETPLQRGRGAKIVADLDKIVAAFVRETEPRQRKIDEERSRLVLAAIRILHPDMPPDGPFSPQFLAEIVVRLQEDQRRERLMSFGDYVAATSRPGLTSAQRRLLFNAALRDLKLPLPPGVRRPVFRFDEP